MPDDGRNYDFTLEAEEISGNSCFSGPSASQSINQSINRSIVLTCAEKPIDVHTYTHVPNDKQKTKNR